MRRRRRPPRRPQSGHPSRQPAQAHLVLGILVNAHTLGHWEEENGDAGRAGQRGHPGPGGVWPPRGVTPRRSRPHPPAPTNHRCRRGSTSRARSHSSLQIPAGTWTASPGTGWCCTLGGGGRRGEGGGCGHRPPPTPVLRWTCPEGPQVSGSPAQGGGENTLGGCRATPGPPAPSTVPEVALLQDVMLQQVSAGLTSVSG